MCNSLRLERLDLSIGHLIPIRLITGEQSKALWNGHAREESLEDWTSKGWQECKIVANSFQEGRPPVDYSIPASQCIKGIYQDIIVSSVPIRVVNIVTRAATNKEKKVHPRFPRLIDL